MKPIFLLALFVSTPITASAGTNIYVGIAKPAGGFVSMDKIDHSAWSELLGNHVDESGRVDYRSWEASTAEQQKLTTYLNTLSRADTRASASKNAKLAFWINAYNAVTIEGMLRVYPTSSIRNHTAKLFGYNIWDDHQLYVGGTAYSLNQIEHEILRKMTEPRIHFAIVCASKSCPRLKNQAYQATKLNEQLDENATHFFAQLANFKIAGGIVTLSPILDWFAEDFGDGDTAVLTRITPWLEPSDAKKLASRTNWTVDHSDYDWSINE